MTPLQLGALVTAISNGGTLFYLQHPASPSSRQFSAAREAPSRHRAGDSRAFRRHGWSGCLRHGAQPALELQRRIDLGKTGLARTPARASDGSLRMPTPILDAL